MVGEIISEHRATSNRNGGRHHRGFEGDFPRNPQWYVQTACTEPDVPDPTARWSRESTITTVIIDLITGASTALLAYTAPVALVLMGRQSSADPIKAIPDQTGGLQPTSAQQDPKD